MIRAKINRYKKTDVINLAAIIDDNVVQIKGDFCGKCSFNCSNCEVRRLCKDMQNFLLFVQTEISSNYPHIRQ